MKASLLNKLDILQDRFEELTALLGDAEVISDQNRFRAYSREYAEVEPVIVAYRQLCKVQQDLEGAQALLKDSDPDMREMAEEEVAEAKAQLETLKPICNACCCPRTRTTGATCSWKSVPVPAATRRRSSPATCSACIRATPRNRAGAWRSFPRVRASTAVTRK